MNKKGFSIVEVVIALAILFIVSAAVLSTFLVVDSLTSRYNDRLFLGYSVESIVECYYNTDNQADFLEDIDFCFGDGSVQDTESGHRLYYSKGNAASESDYKYYVDFVWAANVLTISATDNKGNEVLAERGYSK